MPDPRFTPFRERIFAFYKWRWDQECAWDASESNQLSRLLKSSPNLEINQFSRWLYNYGQSEDIAPGERPRAFLPRIHRYSVTNLDRYGRDPNAKSGQTFAERDESATRQAIRAARQNRHGLVPDVQPDRKTIIGGQDKSVAPRPFPLLGQGH